MNNKFWILIAAIVSVAILAMGWFLGVSPKVDEMNTANQQRVEVENQNRLHEVKLAALKKQFTGIDELKGKLEEAQLGLPPGDDLSTFLGQLHDLEGSSGVVISSFAASDGQQYVAADGAQVVSPLVTTANFVAITIDLTASGTRDQVINFLHDLQLGKRLFLVNDLTVTQNTSMPDLYDGKITGFVYVLVDPSAPPPTPTPVGSLDSQNEAEVAPGG